MSLFKSRFAKLETFVNTKADERTPEMLAAAQEELDRASADIILVGKTETITSPAALEAHIDGLETAATTAKEEATKAQQALTELKGTRVVDDARATADAGNGGDAGTAKTEEEKEVERLQAKVQLMPHYQRLDAIQNN